MIYSAILGLVFFAVPEFVPGAVLPVVSALILRLSGSVNLIWPAFILTEPAGIPFAVFLWRSSRRRVGSDFASGVG